MAYDLEEHLSRKVREFQGFDMNAELLLNDAADYFAAELPKKVDKRAWAHLLVYAPTSVLLRALWRRWTKRFRYRWRH